MGALLGLLASVIPSVIGAMSKGGSGRSTQDNAATRPPVPEFRGMGRSGPAVTSGPTLQDPGSRQAYQDPNIRLAALDQFRQKLGV